METNENIEMALATLQSVVPNAIEQPAVIRLAPDNDAFVLGNRQGYIQLAISALKAAQGNTQAFKDEPWIGTEELDWGVRGLRYDPAAQTHIRPRARGWFRDKIYLVFAAIIAIILLAVFSAGLVQICSGFRH